MGATLVKMGLQEDVRLAYLLMNEHSGAWAYKTRVGVNFMRRTLLGDEFVARYGGALRAEPDERGHLPKLRWQ